MRCYGTQTQSQLACSSQIFDLSKNRTKTGCNAGSLMGNHAFCCVLRSSTVLPSRFLTFSLSLFSLPRGTDILYSHFFSLFQPVLKLCTVLLSHFLSLFLCLFAVLIFCTLTFSHVFSLFMIIRVSRGTRAYRAVLMRAVRARVMRAVLARVISSTRARHARYSIGKVLD